MTLKLRSLFKLPLILASLAVTAIILGIYGFRLYESIVFSDPSIFPPYRSAMIEALCAMFAIRDEFCSNPSNQDYRTLGAVLQEDWIPSGEITYDELMELLPFLNSSPDCTNCSIEIWPSFLLFARLNDASKQVLSLNPQLPHDIYTPWVCGRTVAAGDAEDLIAAIQDTEVRNFICLDGHSTYTLTRPIPPIEHRVAIFGYGATIQRSSDAPPFRLFTVQPDGRLYLSYVVLENGDAGSEPGGAILYTGENWSLHIDNSRLADNRAAYGGAIYAETDVNLRNVILSDNSAAAGGAIHASGWEITIEGGAIIRNHAEMGGGIYIDDVDTALSVGDADITGNTALIAGGALYQRAGVTLLQATRFGDNDAPRGADVSVDSGRIGVINSVVNDQLWSVAPGVQTLMRAAHPEN